MDESYHSTLAAGIEKRYRQLEQDIMEDIIRRIRKAGMITDAADWQIQRLIILGNSTQDIEDMIRRVVDGNEEEVRRLYGEVIEREYTRDRELYEKVGKDFIPYEQNPELQQITNASLPFPTFITAIWTAPSRAWPTAPMTITHWSDAWSAR